MTILWAAMTALLLIAFAFMCWPLMPFLRQKHTAHANQRQENISIFRDRLYELEQEKLQGNMEQATFLQLKAELEKTLLQDTQEQEDQDYTAVEVTAKHWLQIVILGIIVTAVSLGMYFTLGRSNDLAIYQAMGGQPPVSQKTKQQEAPSMEQAVKLLEAKLGDDPENKEKLYLLANSYMQMGQFAKATDIYARMADITQTGTEEYASIKGAQAQSLFQASGEQMTDEVTALIEQSLNSDPHEPLSLMLQGIAAFSTDQYQQAIKYWEKAKKKAGEAQSAQFIDPAIIAAQEKLGIASAPTQQVKEAPISDSEATKAVSLVINLTLNESLKAKVSDEDTLFVFARPVGGRMPLAAERIKVKDLPAQIILDDSKAVMPTAKLSSVDVVDIVARVSLSGQPREQKGDLYAKLKNVAVKEGPAFPLEINRVVE
jgi:cytochrome c-type biogenesis protein CcmH